MNHQPEDACRQHLPKLGVKGITRTLGEVWCCPDCNRLWYLARNPDGDYGVTTGMLAWRLVKGENK